MLKNNKGEVLGLLIKEKVREIEDLLNKKLNLNNNVFVKVDYSFKFTQGLVDDEFIIDVYLLDKDEEKLSFKFSSADTLFINKITNVINDTIKNSASFKQSYYKNQGLYYLELLNDIEQNSVSLDY